MLHLAFDSEDSIVQDDYYNEGRSINLDLHKVEQARVRNIETYMKFSADSVQIEVVQGDVGDGSALILDFFHSTQNFKDFKVTLLKDANGIYRGNIEQAIDGKWRISLHPHDNSWKIQQVVYLPQSKALLFKP
ncbi:nitrogen fixation protein FixH [Paraglaciecola hydrolytica]|uniref:Nitrogen fixation protein FixH n=2 Tax=Paraglaciecola hydrolytica TaxID=1799789 RepID=A0A136A2M4_9ALTE|nr:nitrogen fixation protein FixH [Paraglaciecola hydrolytica]